ncbi:uncharacterized protein LOC123511145 [Portunus trituberculatus]|uniref:uncharacterized protein LOC123511145 n=1 Tax=Portunus trituberculatus TaxID=210409 RepID=UPI001E1CFE1C|nr:uncharacterized protein LOC123511145 [Portunus trituberculatus]
MTELTCLVCLIPYDAEDHRPLLLPACGHTFCAVCLGYLHGQGNTSCPKCRKDGAVQPVSSLPVNYSLLEIAEDSACKTSDVAEPNSANSRAAGASKPKKPTPNSNSFCLNTIANPFGIAGASRHQQPTPHSGLNGIYPFEAADASTPITYQNCYQMPLINPFGIASVSRPQALTPYNYQGSDFLHWSPIRSVPPVLSGGSSQLAPQEASNSSSPPRPTGSLSPIESFLASPDNHPSSAPSSPSIHQNQVRKDQLLQNLLGFHPSVSQAASQQVARAIFKKSLTKTLRRNNTASPPPARTQDDQNSASAIFTAQEKEQQDELDFQMAVHLTFCKDRSHDRDLHNRCSSWRLQNL